LRAVACIFNYMTGYAEPTVEKLAVSPLTLRNAFTNISMRKLRSPVGSQPRSDEDNAMVDPAHRCALRSLVPAQIDLVVRGSCFLTGHRISENIRVKLDRGSLS
jgi:polyphosphate kinase